MFPFFPTKKVVKFFLVVGSCQFLLNDSFVKLILMLLIEVCILPLGRDISGLPFWIKVKMLFFCFHVCAMLSWWWLQMLCCEQSLNSLFLLGYLCSFTKWLMEEHWITKNKVEYRITVNFCGDFNLANWQFFFTKLPKLIALNTRARARECDA